MIGGVSKEETRCGTGAKFMTHGGACVGIAKTPEGAKMRVRGSAIIEEVERSEVM